MLIQIMGGGDPNSGSCDEPGFYQDMNHILVDPTLFQVLAEVDHVYATYCALFESFTSASLPEAFVVDGYDEDGSDEYAWRFIYCVASPRDDDDDRTFSGFLGYDEAAVVAEVAKQDNEAAAAAGGSKKKGGKGKKK